MKDYQVIWMSWLLEIKQQTTSLHCWTCTSYKWNSSHHRVHIGPTGVSYKKSWCSWADCNWVQWSEYSYRQVLNNQKRTAIRCKNLEAEHHVLCSFSSWQNFQRGQRMQVKLNCINNYRITQILDYLISTPNVPW